jgi:hypothetical protein
MLLLLLSAFIMIPYMIVSIRIINHPFHKHVSQRGLLNARLSHTHPLDMSQRSTPATVSPLSRSFLDASTAIDDLTRSLADYSRVSTPEPPSHLPRCECNTEESEYTRAWLAVKAKLESRLVLSAGASYNPFVTRFKLITHRGWAGFVTETRSIRSEDAGPSPFQFSFVRLSTNLSRPRSVLTSERN